MFGGTQTSIALSGNHPAKSNIFMNQWLIIQANRAERRLRCTINDCVEFPLTYIGDGVVSTLDAFPISPADMKAAKDWSTSENFEIDIVAHSETKAHVLMKNCRRLRADGSLIEEASGFYAYRYTSDGWKLYAISDIVMTA